MAKPPPAPPPRPHLLINLDTKCSHFLHTLFHPFLPTFLLLLLELSADFRFSFPISIALLLSPLSPPLLPLFSPLLLGLLLDLALIGLIKVIVRRPRPVYNPNMIAAVSVDHFSFPSGHSSRVFFVAALVSLSVESIQAALVELRANGSLIQRFIVGGDGKVVETVVLVVCAWAILTAVSRVLLGRHFVLDVFAGATLGILEGIFAFRYLRFETNFSTLLYGKDGQGRILSS